LGSRCGGEVNPIFWTQELSFGQPLSTNSFSSGDVLAIIHEKFGDGILSAIDFEMDIQKKPDPKGDRVVVTLNGKFLPYRKW